MTGISECPGNGSADHHGLPHRLVILDQKAREVGHLIDDDRYLSETLHPVFRHVRLVSSQTSIVKARDVTPGLDVERFPPARGGAWVPSRVKEIRRLLRVDTGKFDLALIQSFAELPTLMFLFKNRHLPTSLISTNNLTGPGTASRRRRLLHALIFRSAHCVFVHSRFEADRALAAAWPSSEPRVVIKPYHGIRPGPPIVPLEERSRRIVFLGTGRPGRGLDSFLTWAQSDPHGSLKYAAYGRLGLEGFSPSGGIHSSHLSIHDRYVEDTEYFGALSTALLVALPFDRSYEGRLSGPFCEAIRYGTPILAARIEPHIEFFERFGPFGYLVDPSQASEVHELLSDPERIRRDWPAFQESMERARKAHSRERVRDALLEGLLGEHRSGTKGVRFGREPAALSMRMR